MGLHGDCMGLHGDCIGWHEEEIGIVSRLYMDCISFFHGITLGLYRECVRSTWRLLGGCSGMYRDCMVTAWRLYRGFMVITRGFYDDGMGIV